MKTSAPQKLKFLRFKRRLRLSHWQAVGLLESIWLATYANAPDGDLGRLSNEDIAAAIEYDGDADDMISALVETGWLDADPQFRLIVHDWSDHCATSHKGNHVRYGKEFADQVVKGRKDGPQNARGEPPRESPSGGPSSPPLTSPNHYPPPPSSASGTAPAAEAAARPVVADGADQGQADWAVVESALRAVGMTDASGCVAAARDRGLTAREVGALVAHWSSSRPAWNLGALHWRITRGAPGEPAADGWPPPSEAHLHAQRRAAARAEADRLAAAAEAELARQRAAWGNGRSASAARGAQ